MSNLIPELRTDKNGRVSRRWVKSASSTPESKKQMPSPALKQPAPLLHPNHLSQAEMIQFENRVRDVTSVRKHFNPREAALVSRMLDNGFPESGVGELTNYMGMFSTGERVRNYDYNVFLVSERFHKRYGWVDDSGYYGTMTQHIGGLLYKSIDEDTNQIPVIESDEELEHYANVLRYTTHPSIIDKHVKTFGGWRNVEVSAPVAPFIPDIIREYPDRVDDIIAYVASRDMSRYKREIIPLKQYLDAPVSTLSSGWL